MAIIEPWSDAYGAEYISPAAEEIARLEQEIDTAIRKTRKGEVVSVQIGMVTTKSGGTEVSCRYSYEAIIETMRRCKAVGWFVSGLEHSADRVLIRLVPPSGLPASSIERGHETVGTRPWARDRGLMLNYCPWCGKRPMNIVSVNTRAYEPMDRS